MMNKNIKVIAFDADDTLWSNEPFFRNVEEQFTALMSEYGTPEHISSELFKTEMDNMNSLGYGAKAFTISMVETALRLSGKLVQGSVIGRIIGLGKSLLEIPVEPLDGVVETLKLLKEKDDYRLVVATKGDLQDQVNKLRRSGLVPFFDHVEVLLDKKERDYLHLFDRLNTAPENFVMIGNSFKSDIAPVLALGGYAVHIPCELTWAHENMETFDHPNLQSISRIEDLINIF